MPCAITEPGNYPDYLKSILKKIAVGKDTDLKSCACSLRSPVNDDGCLALDSNGKVGAFTQCIEPASSPDECPWTLEKAMSMYWRVKTWTFSVSGLEGEGGEPGAIYPFSSTISNISSGNYDWGDYYTLQEQLVCGNSPWFSGFGEYDEIIGFLGFDNPKKSGDLYTSGISGYMYNEGLVCEFRVYPEYPNDDPDTNHSGIVTVLGATLPLNIYYFDPEVAITFANVTATLTPTSYWPTLGSNLG